MAVNESHSCSAQFILVDYTDLITYRKMGYVIISSTAVTGLILTLISESDRHECH